MWKHVMWCNRLGYNQLINVWNVNNDIIMFSIFFSESGVTPLKDHSGGNKWLLSPLNLGAAKCAAALLPPFYCWPPWPPTPAPSFIVSRRPRQRLGRAHRRQLLLATQVAHLSICFLVAKLLYKSKYPPVCPSVNHVIFPAPNWDIAPIFFVQIPLINEHLFCKYFVRLSVGNATKGFATYGCCHPCFYAKKCYNLVFDFHVFQVIILVFLIVTLTSPMVVKVPPLLPLIYNPSYPICTYIYQFGKDYI